MNRQEAGCCNRYWYIIYLQPKSIYNEFSPIICCAINRMWTGSVMPRAENLYSHSYWLSNYSLLYYRLRIFSTLVFLVAHRANRSRAKATTRHSNRLIIPNQLIQVYQWEWLATHTCTFPSFLTSLILLILCSINFG